MSASSPGRPLPHPTRQQLEELEALMQRMLALPVQPLPGEEAEGEPLAAPAVSTAGGNFASRATPATVGPSDAAKPVAEVATPGQRKAEETVAVGASEADPAAVGRNEADSVVVEANEADSAIPAPPTGDSVAPWREGRRSIPLLPRGFAEPILWPFQPAAERPSSAASARPFPEPVATVRAIEVHAEPEPPQELEPVLVRQTGELSAESILARRVPWWLRCLVACNRGFDAAARALGPLGRGLTTPQARAILGWIGLLMLASAVAWGLHDWLGWNW
ncbi:MAG: hypothetical protein NZ700_13020 [Gemmataceae bacterium]|nr:hypothetical protein [Gemmataceae bacterium]MDW8266252.1 hypothetical protein [Gemmataceae bacterium]